jgi:hypothetical protein
MACEIENSYPLIIYGTSVLTLSLEHSRMTLSNMKVIARGYSALVTYEIRKRKFKFHFIMINNTVNVRLKADTPFRSWKTLSV